MSSDESILKDRDPCNPFMKSPPDGIVRNTIPPMSMTIPHEHIVEVDIIMGRIIEASDVLKHMSHL